jgi:cytochrome bd-type quinol oxidase subunit 2
MFYIWALVLGPIALIAIALRCYARLRLTKEFGNDDWMIVVVGSVIVVMVALYVKSTFFPRIIRPS